jgi:peptidoglycan/LPS O-acetylase OafA/YrhL
LDQRHHIDELQSLRGVAALIVAISHISSIYTLSAGPRIAIDAILNAHACIVVFFVLSGYVLTGSLVRRGLSWPSVRLFYLARVLRLFPALWVASAISALFLLLCPNLSIRPPASYWFAPYVHGFPTPSKLVLAALAIDSALIMPVWTVFIELVGSAVMPLFVVATVANQRLLLWVLAGLGLSSWWLAQAPHRLDALVYLFDFGLGACLASRSWKFFTENLSLKLSIAGLTLLLFRFTWLAIRNGHPVPLYIGYLYPVPLLIEGVAAFFVVGALASEHGRVHFLRTRAAVWLGNISYSLYLIHFPVAILVTKLLSRIFSDGTSPVVATAILLALALPVSFAISFLIYRFIEIPFIALGKRLSKRLTLLSVPAEI